jgi:D-lyxose ketol-isomerase
VITRQQFDEATSRALSYFERAAIAVTADEAKRIEVADFGMGRLGEVGLELLVYLNTDRCCAKELVIFPYQTCPEHRHPPVSGEPGKEETFRCRWGEVYIYVPGEPVKRPAAKLPADVSPFMTAWHEVKLLPGEQYTLQPNTAHWFQAGAQGAVVSEFSTKSRDESDVFTDPRIQRNTVIQG